jgi:FtsH-binding integral membrane protein
MAWFYIALVLATATGVFLVGRMLRMHSAKRYIGAWICLASGGGFLLIYALNYALEGDNGVLNLAAGATTCLIGIVALVGASVKRST